MSEMPPQITSHENKDDLFKIILIGNPNVGKSVVFGHLTGTYVTVSNYPGTTVDIYKGHSHLNDRCLEVIDTPGMSSLEAISEDERVTRNILLSETHHSVVQVGDSKNLARTLYLHLQLMEAGLPLILALNMQDEAIARGIQTDVPMLEKALGIPVILTTATKRLGLDQLKTKLFHPLRSKSPVVYHSAVEKAIESLSPFLGKQSFTQRSLALMILISGEKLDETLKDLGLLDKKNLIKEIIKTVEDSFEEPLGLEIAKERYQWVNQLVAKVQKRDPKLAKNQSHISSKIGNFCVHPLFGFVALALVLYVAYQVVGVFGAGYLVDLMESTLFGEYISPFFIWLFEKILPSGAVFQFLNDLFVGEYGLITMGLSYSFAIILPIVSSFFILFSIMEDSGYLPRLAYMLNNHFKRIGLNGKAVLPMVLGLGCDTMATLTARIMESKKERILVILLLALGIPCSAQLGVILGMLGSLPLWAGFFWIGSVVLVLMVVGWAAARLLPGKGSDFIMIMPPIRIPRLKNILIKTFARLEWYLKEAVPLFLYATFALFLLDKLGLLNKIINMGRPLVVGVLNLPPEASEAFLVGFLRRDFGATRFFDFYLEGKMDVIQTVVSMIVITLFIPCVANVMMIYKERGLRTTAYIVGFIFPFAFIVGGIANWILR